MMTPTTTNKPATFAGDAQPPKGPKLNDGPEIDLFGELMAAFFPAPIPVTVTPVPDGGAPGDSHSEANPTEAADAPHLLPTGASIAADAEQVDSAQRPPVPVPAVPAPMERPRARLFQKLMTGDVPSDSELHEKLKILANNSRERFPTALKIDPDVRLPITPPKQVADVCVMPPVKAEAVVCGMPDAKGALGDAIRSHISEPQAMHGSAPVAMIPRESPDESVEIVVLELPAEVPPKQEIADESEPVLEVSAVAVQDPHPSAMPESAPLISSVPAAVQHARHKRDLNAASRQDRIELEPKAAEPKTAQSRTLLEVFTNKVLADVRSSQTARTLVKEGVESETASPAIAEHVVEKERAITGIEFGFDTSVGGDTQVAQPENPTLSDGKMRRLMLDQVGSQLNDMAAAQRPGEGKRVLTIKLSPAELGSVEITLSKNAEGVIDAHFRTDNPHAQNAINDTLNQLRESLERSGMQVGNLNTSCSSSFANPQGGSSDRDERQAVSPAAMPAAARPQSSAKSDGGEDRLVSLRA